MSDTIHGILFLGGMVAVMVSLCALLGWAIDEWIKEIQRRGKE